MEKIIYDENNGLWYELQGDYYIPCLKFPDEEEREIGVWGNAAFELSKTTPQSHLQPPSSRI